MTMLRTFFSANAWLLATIAGLLVTIASWDAWRIGKAEKRGSDVALTKVDTQAKEKARDARKAREPARQPGAAERLRTRENCRDC